LEDGLKNGIISCIFFLLMAAGLMPVIGCGDAKYTHNDMLEELGVDTDIGELETPAGEPVRENYNPVNKPVMQLAKRSEIFVAGYPGWSGDIWDENTPHHAVLDWPDPIQTTTDFTRYIISGDDEWLLSERAMAAGDVDGDGVDEIFVAYMKTSEQAGYVVDLAFRVIKYEDGQYTVIAENTVDSYTGADLTDMTGYDYDTEYYMYFSEYFGWINNFNAVCGDADGNGLAETLISFNKSLFLIGDSAGSYDCIKSVTYDKSTAYKLLKTSAGDVDNNGADEFVVVENDVESDLLSGTAVYHIYTGAALDELDSGSVAATEGGIPVALKSASCAVGDLDADGLNEVLFAGQAEGDASYNYYMMILDTEWDESSGRFTFSFLPQYESFSSGSIEHIAPNCAIADFDGDGEKEFIGFKYMYKNLSETDGSFVRESAVSDVLSLVSEGCLYDAGMTIGDIDGDGRADIAYISIDRDMYCMGFNLTNQWVRKGGGSLEGHGVDNPWCPTVVMGNFDGNDCIAIEFVESEVLFTDPHPIAVLASNPYWSDIDMYGETSFGVGTGIEEGTERAIGFSVGFSVGYEFEGLFNSWDVSIKASFESSFDWTASESLSIEETCTYTTENEDKVIFATVPYDVFYYRVINSPDPAMVGTMITANLPRKAFTIPVERSYYNEHNGSTPDIGGTVLSHTVGHPLSYPSSYQASQLIAAGSNQGVKSVNMMDVGQGSGGTSIEVSVANTGCSTFAFDIGVNIEAEAGVGGFVAGVSAGFHYGESYSITTTSTTIYGGFVENIPADSFDAGRIFSWGLFSYRAALGNDKFIVVQYYTE
jgi:hypothetical protein